MKNVKLINQQASINGIWNKEVFVNNQVVWDDKNYKMD